MSHCLESMFYTDADGRNVPWHGMGTRVFESPNSEDALRVAGLDWEVKQTESFVLLNGVQTPTGDIVNYRDSDNKILGTVSKRYVPVQNREAFAFTDELIGGDVRYETAGSLVDGKLVWMLAKMPSDSILGDAFDRYLLFSNSHDGSSAVRVSITNVRVVCQNTLNMALNGARRYVTFVHKGDMESKLAEARQTLAYADKYHKRFAEEAEHLANKKVSCEDVEKMMNILFPVPDDFMSKIQIERMETMRSNFNQMLQADDLQNFKGTAWQIVNAASDYAYHARPMRLTETYQDNLMKSAMTGHKFLDIAYNFVSNVA